MSYRIPNAQSWAEYNHAEQTDKAGKPYYMHCLAVSRLVAQSGGSEDEIIAALLHDVVEDTERTLEEVRMCWGTDVAEMVGLLTKVPGEPIEHYFTRIKAHPGASLVKQADLTHNMDLSRLDQPAEQDRQRTERYRKWLNYLRE